MTSTGKTCAYVAAVIMLLVGLIVGFFGLLFVWGSSSALAQPGQFGMGIVGLLFGLVLIGGGVGVILWVGQRAKAAAAAANVTLNVDLPGNVQLDSLKCKSCGGALTAENIKMVAGAPMVDCPYCHTTYQLTEAPKW